jgi:hypothetical protein
MRIAHETCAYEAEIEVFQRYSPSEGIIDIVLLSLWPYRRRGWEQGYNIGMEQIFQ